MLGPFATRLSVKILLVAPLLVPLQNQRICLDADDLNDDVSTFTQLSLS